MNSVFGFRAALEDSIYYIDEVLVKYRVGVGMTTRPPQVKNNFNLKLEADLKV